jgi:hypothetical protein
VMASYSHSGMTAQRPDSYPAPDSVSPPQSRRGILSGGFPMNRRVVVICGLVAAGLAVPVRSARFVVQVGGQKVDELNLSKKLVRVM